MEAREVMTLAVISVEPEASISDAVSLMLENRVSGLPVIDSAGKLVGIVTEGDFLRRSELGTQHRRARWIEWFVSSGHLASEYVRTSGRKIHQVMTTNVHTASEDTTLEDIVRLMERNRIKRVPILRGGKVVGIVTRADLLRALSRVAHVIRPPSAEDLTIRERLLAELRNQTWAPPGAIHVLVSDGVVTLAGVIADERQRQAVLVAGENIPGAKKVVDQLVWIDPPPIL
jgi:CBS domain-containing protein